MATNLAASLLVIATSGCSSGPRPSPTATPCVSASKSRLKTGETARGHIRWVARLATCYRGDPSISLGAPVVGLAVSPEMTVALFGHQVYGLATPDGHLVWSATVVVEPPPSPPSNHLEYTSADVALTTDAIIVAVSAQPSGDASCCAALSVAYLDRATGRPRRVSKVSLPPSAARGFDLKVAAGMVVFATREDIGAVDPATGNVWTKPQRRGVSGGSLSVIGDSVYVDTHSASAASAAPIDRLAVRTGAPVPKLSLPEPISDVITTFRDLLIVEGPTGSIGAVNTRTGTLAWRLEQPLSRPIFDPAGGRIGGWDDQRRLRVFSMRNGELLNTSPLTQDACSVIGPMPVLVHDALICSRSGLGGAATPDDRFAILDISTGNTVAQTPPLPMWSATPVGGIALGKACVGRTQTTVHVCDEVDIVAINA